MALNIKDDNFEAIVAEGKPVVLDIWATWCGPCRAIAPVIEELANDYDGKAVIAKLDVDQNPDTAAKFGIRSIPTLHVFKGGEVVEQIVGAVPKATLEEKINNHL